MKKHIFNVRNHTCILCGMHVSIGTHDTECMKARDGSMSPETNKVDGQVDAIIESIDTSILSDLVNVLLSFDEDGVSESQINTLKTLNKRPVSISSIGRMKYTPAFYEDLLILEEKALIELNGANNWMVSLKGIEVLDSIKPKELLLDYTEIICLLMVNEEARSMSEVIKHGYRNTLPRLLNTGLIINHGGKLSITNLGKSHVAKILGLPVVK